MQPNTLNPLQISLLRLFSRPITDDQISDLKSVLVQHYSILLHQNIQDFEKNKEYSEQDFNDMLFAKS